MSQSIRGILKSELIHVRNADIHIERICKALEKELTWKVLDSCCSVLKQAIARVPEDKIREDFVNYLKG